MKKIILSSILSFAAIALFSFASSTVKTLELTNGTKFTIDEMWITPSDSKEWEYEVTFEKAVTAGKGVEISVAELKKNFDVLTYDKKAKKFHEYDDFKVADLATTNFVLQGDEAETSKHGPNPATK
jgi:hypothetical protein